MNQRELWADRILDTPILRFCLLRVASFCRGDKGKDLPFLGQSCETHRFSFWMRPLALWTSTLKKLSKHLWIGGMRVIIAHRLSTIKGADHIVDLEKGKIVEEGSHVNLLKRRDFTKKFGQNSLAT
jgi:hypothetical protein